MLSPGQKKEKRMAYTPSEMMIVAAARALAGALTVFVGIGLPNVACNLAQRTVAPQLELIYEAGVYGARPARLPLSIGDPTLVSGSLAAMPMADLFGLYLQGGRVEVAMLGGAQIDRFGNLNSTVIGSYEKPMVRLPGSGGAAEIALHAKRTLVIMRLSKRAFVETLDFQTSPGHLEGGDARVRHGLPGAGPTLVVTDMALFDFAPPAHEMRLVSLHPGITIDQVRSLIGWDVCVAADLGQTPAPSDAELVAIRQELDPQGLYR